MYHFRRTLGILVKKAATVHDRLFLVFLYNVRLKLLFHQLANHYIINTGPVRLKDN